MGFKLCQISIDISFIGEYLNNRHGLGIDCLINDLKCTLVLKVSKFLLSSSHELILIWMSL